jgi:hypothetical protein
VKQYALQRLGLFNASIKIYRAQAEEMGSLGLNVSSLYQILQNAQVQIISPFASAVSKASNSSQIYSAVNMYCLYDGCVNGTNFHLPSHFYLQALTLQLNYLRADKNVSAASLAPASAHLNNASAIIQSVGTKVYVDSQEGKILNNLTAASKEMQPAREQDALAKLKHVGGKVINNYQNLIAEYRKGIGELPKGINTGQLNMTISQAESQVITPLQSKLNSSNNATQLYNMLHENCLGNICGNGKNFHLAAKLELDQDEAYLSYLGSKANASSNITVNRTALAAAQADVNGASALISTVGGSQLNQSQASQLASYFSDFTVELRSAFNFNNSRLPKASNILIANSNGKGGTTVQSAYNSTNKPNASVR